MNRYLVKRPFTDYGMHHAVGTIITDASIISNKDVKLWEGTLGLLDDNGKEIPFHKIAEHTQENAETPSNNPKPVQPKVVETPKVTQAATPVVKKTSTTTVTKKTEPVKPVTVTKVTTAAPTK